MSKSASGAGTIRKKTVTRNGKNYTFWEGRLTVGYDPGTGKQKQRSFSGKTQKEVREKMQAAAVSLTDGTYFEPSKLTVSEWLDIWLVDYCRTVKPLTLRAYRTSCETHIRPALGAVKLSDLSPIHCQRFINGATNKATGKPLSPKSVKNLHGVLHRCLETAVRAGVIKSNPADRTELPRMEKYEISPLDDAQTAKFIQAVRGHKFESIFIVTLLTGMREAEVLGLSWDCVDFKSGTITISQQLQRIDGEYQLITPKSNKARVLYPAQAVMDILKHQHTAQARYRLAAGAAWHNPLNLVFTTECGGNISPTTLYKSFKRIVADMGIPQERYHDLRHSYATAALKNGDSLKDVQEALGHATASFTLDIYGHVTEEMKRDSANRMQEYYTALTQKQA